MAKTKSGKATLSESDLRAQAIALRNAGKTRQEVAQSLGRSVGKDTRKVITFTTNLVQDVLLASLHEPKTLPGRQRGKDTSHVAD